MQGQWHFYLSPSNGVSTTSGPQPTTPTTTTTTTTTNTPNPNMTRYQPFVKKLLLILDDKNNRNLISWSSNGDFFRVYDCDEFSRVILPRYFRHSNWTSFVRQLNMYDFHKLSDTNFGLEPWKPNVTLIPSINNIKNNTRNNSPPWEFKHENFRRNATKGQLSQIKRKRPKDHSTLHIQYADTMNFIEQSVDSNSSNDRSGNNLTANRSTPTMSNFIPPTSPHPLYFPTGVAPITTTIPQQQHKSFFHQHQHPISLSDMNVAYLHKLEDQLEALSSLFDGLIDDLVELRSIVEFQNRTISNVSDFMHRLTQTKSRGLIPHDDGSLSSIRLSNSRLYSTNDQTNESIYDVPYQQLSYDKRQHQSQPEARSDEVAEGLMRSRHSHSPTKQENDNTSGYEGDGDGNKKLLRRSNKRANSGRDELIITSKNVSEPVNDYYLLSSYHCNSIPGKETPIYNIPRRISSTDSASNTSSSSSSFSLECGFIPNFYRDGKESTIMGDDGLSKINQNQQGSCNGLTLPLSSSATPGKKKKKARSSS
ncbi:hypothetical protein INT45_011105 [Circinella minor]|uniref:HSF-type DNA-binding domain-containing protein n=1 Tax=Circinella minor TaxID=1195481 RepID=A0A8H7SHR1_9FUNG|nr:hypothetical protein INT45_011105 [Circinella minor]